MKIKGNCVTKCIKKSDFISGNFPVDSDKIDLENEIVIDTQ